MSTGPAETFNEPGYTGFQASTAIVSLELSPHLSLSYRRHEVSFRTVR